MSLPSQSEASIQPRTSLRNTRPVQSKSLLGTTGNGRDSLQGKCCGDCNANSLRDAKDAVSGLPLNATGAIALVNLWGNGLGAVQVTGHPEPGTLAYDAMFPLTPS